MHGYLALIIAFFLLGGTTGHMKGQATRHLLVDAGMNLTHLRDFSMSPHIYSGTGIGGRLGYEGIRNSKTEIYLAGFDRTMIRNGFEGEVEYLGFEIKNYTFYHSGKESLHGLHWGWSNINRLASFEHFTYGNYGSRSYYFTSFGPATIYSSGFTLFKREFSFIAMADIQLLGFYLRPSYISASPEGFLDPELSVIDSFLRSIELFVPGRAWNIGFSPGIRYHLSSGNILSLEYDYGYVRISAPEPVTESQGQWFFRMITRL